MLIIIIWLIVAGLCLGSFVNAAVWRVHEQSEETEKKRPNRTYLKSLSITRGRSMCTHCHHELAAKDLIPVFSWLILKGKCRYCAKPIPDSPLVEITTALLFVGSYIWWPLMISGWQVVVFVLWLTLVVGLMILVVYDLRWLLLPNKVIYPLAVIAIMQSVIIILTSEEPLNILINSLLAVAVGGGIFFLLFQISGGKWIGGGDVKLGWLLGLIMATPARSLLFIFIAALGGSLVSLPMLWSGRLKHDSTIPFGPFLIIGAIIVQLFGVDILSWYQHLILASG